MINKQTQIKLLVVNMLDEGPNYAMMARGDNTDIEGRTQPNHVA